MKLLILCLLYYTQLVICNVVSFTGKYSLHPKNLTIDDISRVDFRIYQIGNYTNKPFSQSTKVNSIDGLFTFNNLPLNRGNNVTTDFVIYSTSLDYNLKPVRILLTYTSWDDEANNHTVKAYSNFVGREYFPDKDIIFPDKLEELSMDPYLEVTYFNKAPYRLYYQERNEGILSTGIIGNILSSRWKTAGVITMILLIIFPYVVERLDPETSQLLREEVQRKQREKYQIQQ
ncbi:hypothetical protein Kpol_2002p55 [Vanderwaltozyma polyspora DSM 70294]|uniref:Protein SOP4 n=1 Tax=Vanderwaltozyma polyspora (strain ATCC 22028 / DSM 70294 / BCRC 21397 / CBS 2163 / NBRC 10782 / NRRL Y-8283 / UCD 57-17) TaxID=436907 RepID=SOP4_VANPO|nr:uncharacterized protein Kpol_2002p55 [Vanderwaltozyma polyspora DSM 70294]A7TFH0.1 RecName: Full=Protein SOP4; Flags: Precursor [Vanderwaltozyma polyspora DSM 70294]EDO18984.1 hypothetical protein Kpol_2002p55 [Vanderwaltozyma polyspora DSM 70294]